MDTRIVAGIDGSASSLRAVDWAADEAARRSLPLHLVHTSLWDRYEPDPTDNYELGLARKAVADLVATSMDRAVSRRPEILVDADVLAEAPATALVEESHHASVIVLGSRGHGGFVGLLLGSVSLQVAARAACPVVVVRGEQAALEGRYQRVVLGIGRHDIPRAVAFAFDQASVRQARVDVVRAWRADLDHALFKVHASPATAADSTEAEVRDLLSSAVADAAAHHTQVPVALLPVAGAGAHAALLEAAAEADLLVVGARRRYGSPGLHLGPVSHAVLHHAPRPVAVVPANP